MAKKKPSPPSKFIQAKIHEAKRQEILKRVRGGDDWAISEYMDHVAKHPTQRKEGK